jgi:hypothetical protein
MGASLCAFRNIDFDLRPQIITQLKKWEAGLRPITVCPFPLLVMRQAAITTGMLISQPERANEAEATRDMPGSCSNVPETAI